MQKIYQEEIQKLLNRQGQVITSMYQSTFIAPLISKAGLISARIMLNYCQRKYSYCLLTLPDGQSTKKVLLISLKMSDGSAQPGKLTENDKIWSFNQKIRTYGQHLA